MGTTTESEMAYRLSEKVGGLERVSVADKLPNKYVGMVRDRGARVAVTVASSCDELGATNRKLMGHKTKGTSKIQPLFHLT
jgi:hypothetical protein